MQDTKCNAIKCPCNAIKSPIKATKILKGVPMNVVGDLQGS